MKQSFWTMILGGIGGLFLFYLFLQTSFTHSARINQTNLSESLSNAMIAGAMDTSFEFDEAGAKEEYLTKSSEFLAGTFGAETEGTKEGMMQKIPVMFFISDDGFYASYVESYKAADNGSYYTRVMTEKMPYVFEDGGYNVKFSLSGSVDVAKNNSEEHIEGEYLDVFTALNKPAALSFMSSKEEYESEIRMIIAAKVKDLAEYYIENKLFGNKKALYTINIPQGDSGIARAISDNTVLTLYQGENRNTREGEINIYSLSAVELSPAQKYIIGLTDENGSKVFYYHQDESCPGAHDRYFVGTMLECAEKGALPCPYCVLQ